MYIQYKMLHYEYRRPTQVNIIIIFFSVLLLLYRTVQ